MCSQSVFNMMALELLLYCIVITSGSCNLVILNTLATGFFSCLNYDTVVYIYIYETFHVTVG